MTNTATDANGEPISWGQMYITYEGRVYCSREQPYSTSNLINCREWRFPHGKWQAASGLVKQVRGESVVRIGSIADVAGLDAKAVAVLYRERSAPRKELLQTEFAERRATMTRLRSNPRYAQ